MGNKVIIIFLFLSGIIFSYDYRIDIKVDSGFYTRYDELVKAEIGFDDKKVDIRTFVLREDGKEVSFYFVPGEDNTGTLYWILKGKTEPLTTRTYYLYFSEGTWEKEVYGDEEIKKVVEQKGNLIPNGSFEIEEEGEIKQTSTWKGNRKPVDWVLNDYAWAYRELPSLISICRLSEEEAYQGKKSLKIVSEVRENKSISGFASSTIFPMKPKTKYVFSYYIKITDRKDNGGVWQAVSAEIQLLDENKKRIYPDDYGLNRIHAAYSTARNFEENYLGKWVKVEVVKEVPAEVRYGLVWISVGFTGTVYYDNFVLKEVVGEPLKVEVSEIKKTGGK